MCDCNKHVFACNSTLLQACMFVCVGLRCVRWGLGEGVSTDGWLAILRPCQSYQYDGWMIVFGCLKRFSL